LVDGALNPRICGRASCLAHRVSKPAAVSRKDAVLHRLTYIWTHDKLTILNGVMVIFILAFLYFVVLS
jgi:hypothetical protein